MNYKLIFEAPNLPGGLIFTQVIDPPGNTTRADALALAYGLRFKGWDITDEPVSPLRFAPERFDLGWLVEAVVAIRAPSPEEARRVRAAVASAEAYKARAGEGSELWSENGHYGT